MKKEKPSPLEQLKQKRILSCLLAGLFYFIISSLVFYFLELYNEIKRTDVVFLKLFVENLDSTENPSLKAMFKLQHAVPGEATLTELSINVFLYRQGKFMPLISLYMIDQVELSSNTHTLLLTVGKLDPATAFAVLESLLSKYSVQLLVKGTFTLATKLSPISWLKIPFPFSSNFTKQLFFHAGRTLWLDDKKIYEKKKNKKSTTSEKSIDFGLKLRLEFSKKLSNLPLFFTIPSFAIEVRYFNEKTNSFLSLLDKLVIRSITAVDGLISIKAESSYGSLSLSELRTVFNYLSEKGFFTLCTKLILDDEEESINDNDSVWFDKNSYLIRLVQNKWFYCSLSRKRKVLAKNTS